MRSAENPVLCEVMRLRTAAAASVILALALLFLNVPGGSAQAPSTTRPTCSAAQAVPNCVPVTAPPLSAGATDVMVDAQAHATPPAVPVAGSVRLTG